MKVAIIGAGNMGGAIALGMAKGTIVAANEIFVADPSQANLDKLKQQVPTINTLANNAEAVKDADIVIWKDDPLRFIGGDALITIVDGKIVYCAE